jgi:hypothetical protein
MSNGLQWFCTSLQAVVASVDISATGQVRSGLLVDAYPNCSLQLAVPKAWSENLKVTVASLVHGDTAEPRLKAGMPHCVAARGASLVTRCQA